MARPKSGDRPQKVAKKRVPFSVDAGGAGEVILTGDFTGWNDEGIRLKKAADGLWQAILALDPGEYQYRLRIDGQWRDHPAAQKRVANPYGTENCVLTVN